MVEQLRSLPHAVRILRKNQYLFHQGDVVTSMFLIEAGEARLIRRHLDGRTVILQRALVGSVLAEASLFSESYHCDAVANTRLTVRVIRRDQMKAMFENDKAFASVWASHLSDEVRQARLRAEILSLKTVSERLDAWIADKGTMPAKGYWKTVAQDIGTSAEALYREIAARRAR
ncbi:MAG: Crp/Fnr family transcriptional regulator [Alphaproteobacteria bacterium]|nr:Crp/Fnr family transcriptional regulator [Alphaproteobacteria bacterium]